MSLVITLYVREGIVMATDSRLTLNTREQQGEMIQVNLAVGQSDSNYKLFLAPNNVGISTYGAADINGVPIAGYVESFLAGLKDESNVQNVAGKLLAYFSAFTPVPNTQFHVAGYSIVGEQLEQQLWRVQVFDGMVVRVNPPGEPGASWGGEADILGRLIQSVAQIDQHGNVQQKIPSFQIPWSFFTLQDAIDFAIFAIRSTSDAIRFQARAKTVGGPIDVLVIKPTGALWIQRKQLQGEH